jgi:hypothetical protein
MPLSDDHDLDPVLSTEEFLPPTDEDCLQSLLSLGEDTLQIVQNLPLIDVSLPPTVGNNNYDGWVPVNPPDYRVLTRKFKILGKNKASYKCTFADCPYVGDKKDHCKRHYTVIHINGGNPLMGKRKFKCNDGTSVPQTRKARSSGKVISTSAPAKRQRKKVAQVFSEKIQDDKKFLVKARIQFETGSKLGIKLRFGEFQIDQYTSNQT